MGYLQKKWYMHLRDSVCHPKPDKQCSVSQTPSPALVSRSLAHETLLAWQGGTPASGNSWSYIWLFSCCHWHVSIYVLLPWKPIQSREILKWITHLVMRSSSQLKSDSLAIVVTVNLSLLSCNQFIAMISFSLYCNQSNFSLAPISRTELKSVSVEWEKAKVRITQIAQSAV